MTAAEAMFPNCGLIITGDFNRLNTGRVQNHFKLKQLVKFATRGDAVLDLVLTNMSDHFSSPQSFPPFGLSGHCTVIVQPKRRESNQHTRKSITIRDIRVSKKICLGRYFSNIDWSIVTNQPSCEEKFKAFCEVVDIGMSNIMPERTIKVYPKDVPWMPVRLKELIRLRQQSFHANKNGLAFKFYRNAVNKERKRCKANYYASKVQDLKDVNPRWWWSEVKRLCGSKNQEASLFSSLNVPEYNSMSATDVVNSINDALLKSLLAYEPIEGECELLCVPLEDNPEVLEVSAHRVYNNLTHLNKYKAPGPDGLSNWALKEYAEFLVQPVQNILNASYSEQTLPLAWKMADVSPSLRSNKSPTERKNCDQSHSHPPSRK